jgi:cation transport ATPase
LEICFAIGKYIKYGVANMDTLVGIGTVSAFVYSFVAKTFYDIWPDILSKQVFFEAVIVVIGFIEI